MIINMQELNDFILNIWYLPTNGLKSKIEKRQKAYQSDKQYNLH